MYVDGNAHKSGGSNGSLASDQHPTITTQSAVDNAELMKVFCFNSGYIIVELFAENHEFVVGSPLLDSTRFHIPNGFSIGSSILAQLIVMSNRHTHRHRHTDHATSVTVGRISALRACDAVHCGLITRKGVIKLL